jgi:hypothetical protein
MPFGPAVRDPVPWGRLAMLKPVAWSLPLKIAMLALRGYLVIAALLLLIKAIQLGTG